MMIDHWQKIIGSCVTAVLFFAVDLNSHAAGFTSTYTDIDTASGAPTCSRLAASAAEDGGEFAAVRCSGIHGIDIFIDYDDARDTLRVGQHGRGTPFLPPFTSFGPKAEWRLAADIPIAMIVRMKLHGSEESSGNWLTVHSVDANAGSGCLIGYVDARANKNANILARKLADTAPNRECGRVSLVGNRGKLMKQLTRDYLEKPAERSP